MNQTNPLIGCQCYFWSNGKFGKTRRIGIITAISFNGMLKIRTGYGLEAYHHLRKRTQIELIQPKFKYEREEV